MCIAFFKKYSFFRFLLPKELHIYLIKIKTYFIALNSEHFTANQLKLTWYVQCVSASALLFFFRLYLKLVSVSCAGRIFPWQCGTWYRTGKQSHHEGCVWPVTHQGKYVKVHIPETSWTQCQPDLKTNLLMQNCKSILIWLRGLSYEMELIFLIWLSYWSREFSKLVFWPCLCPFFRETSQGKVHLLWTFCVLLCLSSPAHRICRRCM